MVTVHHWRLPQWLGGPGPGCPGLPPPPARPASPTWRPSAGPRVSCSPEVGRGGTGGGGAGARERAPGRAGGLEEERGRASGCGKRAGEAAARQRTGLRAIPGAFESPKAAATRRWFAKLQDLGNQHAHSSFSSRSSPPSLYLSPLPSRPPSLQLSNPPFQLYLTGDRDFCDGFAAAWGTRWQRRAQVARGWAGHDRRVHYLAAAVAAAVAAAAGEAAPRGQHQNWSVI